jgi:hypothetical protein
VLLKVALDNYVKVIDVVVAGNNAGFSLLMDYPALSIAIYTLLHTHFAVSIWCKMLVALS